MGAFPTGGNTKTINIDMSRFLHLCEEFDPATSDSPKWDLIDYLKSKGVQVSLVKNTDMLYIDTGSKTIPITISDVEEDGQESDGSYQVDKEVESLADKANSGLTGLAARALGTGPQQAKTGVKKRQQLAAKAVNLYNKKTKDLESAISTASRPKPVISF